MAGSPRVHQPDARDFGGIRRHHGEYLIDMARAYDLAEHHFYRERMNADGQPRPWRLADLEDFAAMADRMVAIVKTLQPSMLVLRRDLAVPFAMTLEAAGVQLADCVRWVAVSEVEGAISRGEAEQASARLGVPVWRILRSDAAFL